MGARAGHGASEACEEAAAGQDPCHHEVPEPVEKPEREEVEAANRVALQLLGPLVSVQLADGGPERLAGFLDELGRVRAHDIVLRTGTGDLLYESPPPTYKADRAAPAWFARQFASPPARRHRPGWRRVTSSPRVPRSM